MRTAANVTCCIHQFGVACDATTVGERVAEGIERNTGDPILKLVYALDEPGPGVPL